MSERADDRDGAQRWRDEINASTDPRAIPRILRSYIGSIDPEDLALLPPDCRNTLARLGDHVTEIQAAALALLRADLAYQGSPQVAETLHGIAHTFAVASARLSRMRTDANA